jgi:hypothetical protein
MRYALLNYLDEANWRQLPDDVRATFVGEFASYHASVRERGCFIEANRLMPADCATSVRVRDGEREVADQPATSTPEQLGGYMLIEASDLDEAIELAAHSPLARLGTVEVRPVMEIPAPAPDDSRS